MKQPKQRLFNIKPDEVSFVKKPAIGRPFLVCKADGTKLAVQFESDGTNEGTSIVINGEKLKDASSFYLSFDSLITCSGSKGPNLNCSYSKIVETEDGFQRTESYILARTKGDDKMDELVKVLKEYLGVTDDKAEVLVAKADLSEKAVEALKKALEILKKYKADFPDDLKEAVDTVSKYAVSYYGYGSPEKDDKDTSVNKDKDKDIKKEDDKPNGQSTQEVKDARVDQLVTQVAELTKSLEAVKTLQDRLATVEKATTVSKTIVGQDQNQNNADQSDSKDKFKSIPL